MLPNLNKGDCCAQANVQAHSFVRSGTVVSRNVGGETLIVPVRGKVGDLASIYRFNGTGTLIWQLLDTPRTFTDLVGEVEVEYEVTREQAEKDVKQFLDDLLSVELVEMRPIQTQIETEIKTAEMDGSAIEAVMSTNDSQPQAESAMR